MGLHSALDLLLVGAFERIFLTIGFITMFHHRVGNFFVIFVQPPNRQI